jgi:hypothetical protein
MNLTFPTDMILYPSNKHEEVALSGWQPAFLQGAFPKGHVAMMATGIITRPVAGFLFSKVRDPPDMDCGYCRWTI